MRIHNLISLGILSFLTITVSDDMVIALSECPFCVIALENLLVHPAETASVSALYNVKRRAPESCHLLTAVFQVSGRRTKDSLLFAPARGFFDWQDIV